MKIKSFATFAIAAMLLAVLTFVFFKRDGVVTPPDLLNNTTGITSETCISCHQDYGNKWHGSHHQKAMEVANDQTVLGDFNNATFTHPKTKTADGDKFLTTRFFKQDGKYMVNAQGPDGKMHDYEVLYTFGFEPLQQYLVAFPEGRLQCLTVAWDNHKKQWYDINDTLDVDHKEWIHWSRGGFNWNNMCADCHSTTLKKNYDEKSQTYTTTFEEMNVSCVACHGDGTRHVAWAKNPGGSKDPQIARLSELTHTTYDGTKGPSPLVDSCARCHSRRSQITPHYVLGDPFMDHYFPHILRNDPNMYFDDGQIKGEVYVYGSYVQSKMYHKGVSCTHCHDAHSTQLKLKGNALCMQCHEPQKYNIPQHHGHKMGSQGAECIECHMPGRHYMGIDFRRDHSFRVPRPDQTVLFGKESAPNACNDCHKDKSPEWAAQAVMKWHGPQRKPHYSDVTLLAWRQPATSLKEIVALVANTQEPALVRATMIQFIAPYGFQLDEVAKVMAQCLQDKEPVVRRETLMAISQWPADYRQRMAIPLIQDKIRAVRIAAASLLVEISVDDVKEEFKKPFQKARDEYMASLELALDSPAGQMNMGTHYTRFLGQQLFSRLQHQDPRIKDTDAFKKDKEYTEKAIKAFERVLEIDNNFHQARMNLATLYSRQGKNEKAKKALRVVVEMNPQFWVGHYHMGLLLSELNEPIAAEKSLKEAARLSMGNPGAYYNWALSLQHLNKKLDAKRAYQEGLKYASTDERLLNGMVTLSLQLSNLPEAKKYSERLLKAAPDNENYKRRHEQLMQGR